MALRRNLSQIPLLHPEQIGGEEEEDPCCPPDDDDDTVDIVAVLE
jgi:hypothetical protein